MVGKESSRTDQPVDTEMVRLLSIFERQKLEGMLDIIEQDLSEAELEEDSLKESKTRMLYEYFCREIVAPLNQIES
ncbi:MAG TPA: hypothetical protein VH186_31695 [Chloroflexia bacterium]|nr:hypothetical protein [Chloroflexia bacterium]